MRPNTELTCFGSATQLSGLKRNRISDCANARYSVRLTHRSAVYFASWLIRNQYDILQSSPADRPLARPGPSRAHTRRSQRCDSQQPVGKAAALPACLPAGHILGKSDKPRCGRALLSASFIEDHHTRADSDSAIRRRNTAKLKGSSLYMPCSGSMKSRNKLAPQIAAWLAELHLVLRT